MCGRGACAVCGRGACAVWGGGVVCEGACVVGVRRVRCGGRVGVGA